MKKKMILRKIWILIILIIGILIYPKNDKEVLINKKEKTSSFISMMVEDEEGKYIEKTDLKFPSEEYLFNPEKSGCENGGTLSWNKENEKIEASLITSDKCYAYFDTYDLAKDCKYNKMDNFACDIVKNKNNNLIYHDNKCDYEGEENCDLEAGDLSYRYVGSSEEVFNYVCLDNKENSECADGDLYRIIGLFRNEEGEYEVKLIKNMSIGSRKWNITYETVDGHEANQWEYSSLKKELNSTFYENLKDEVKDILTLHEWQIRGSSSASVLAKQFMNYELGKLEDSGVIYQANPATINAYIGLMYASDYGFSASPMYWNVNLSNYNSIATPENWLYMGDTEWTISRISSDDHSIFLISLPRYTWSTDWVHGSTNIRPCFYLSSNIKLEKGFGNKDNPYYLF